jgi:hypothetical protein
MTAVSDRGLPVVADRWEYSPDRPLGRGYNAQTFAGRDLVTGEAIVVKLLHGFELDDRDGQRFADEADLHAKLDHPAILEVLDYDTKGPAPYLVTPRISPGSLELLVAPGLELRSQPLGPAATRRIGMRVADALAYLRRCKAVHGDVSAGNILIDENGDAFLADFGFSKRVTTSSKATMGDFFGTRGFQSPRPRGTKRTYDDDVYSLAAVLWFCLTGSTPDNHGKGRVDRDAIPNRRLRGPLRRGMRWGHTPEATAFRADIARHWPELDWRQVSTPSRSGQARAAALAGVVGLASAAVAGYELRAPPAEAQTVIAGDELDLTLPGDGWRASRSTAPGRLNLRSPIAARDDTIRIVAGLAQSAGAALVGERARSTLPAGARAPRRALVGERPALVYGPAATSSGSFREIVAMALERNVVVIWCEGPQARVRRACSQAAAGIDVGDRTIAQLAPSIDVAHELRAATRRLNRIRKRQLSRIAAAERREQVVDPARRLRRAHGAFADRVAADASSAREAPAFRAVARAAEATGSVYAELARASTDGEWRSTRARAIDRERELARMLGALRSLGYTVSGETIRRR